MWLLLFSLGSLCFGDAGQDAAGITKHRDAPAPDAAAFKIDERHLEQTNSTPSSSASKECLSAPQRTEVVTLALIQDVNTKAVRNHSLRICVDERILLIKRVKLSASGSSLVVFCSSESDPESELVLTLKARWNPDLMRFCSVGLEQVELPGLGPDFCSKKHLGAFWQENEARCLQGLRGVPGIPKLYGRTARFLGDGFDQGIAYIANTVERVPGVMLNELPLSATGVRDSVSAEVFDLAKGIAARGFVYGDWNFGNLLFTRTATGVSVKLVDFEECYPWRDSSSEASRIAMRLAASGESRADALEAMMKYPHSICLNDLLLSHLPGIPDAVKHSFSSWNCLPREEDRSSSTRRRWNGLSGWLSLEGQKKPNIDKGLDDIHESTEGVRAPSKISGRALPLSALELMRKLDRRRNATALARHFRRPSGFEQLDRVLQLKNPTPPPTLPMSEKDLEAMMTKQDELMKANFALIQREIDQGKEAMTEVETGADLVDAQMDGTDDIVAEFETKGLEKLDASTSAADEAAAEESGLRQELEFTHKEGSHSVVGAHLKLLDKRVRGEISEAAEDISLALTSLKNHLQREMRGERVSSKKSLNDLRIDARTMRKDLRDGVNDVADTLQSNSRDFRASSQTFEAKKFSKKIASLSKTAPSAMGKALREVQKTIGKENRKAFSTAEKATGKMLSKAHKALSKKIAKAFKTMEKKYAKILQKTASQEEDSVKSLNKQGSKAMSSVDGILMEGTTMAGEQDSLRDSMNSLVHEQMQAGQEIEDKLAEIRTKERGAILTAAEEVKTIAKSDKTQSQELAASAETRAVAELDRRSLDFTDTATDTFNRPREDLRKEAEAKRKLSAEELEKLRDADGRARDEFKVVTKTYKEADHLVGLGAKTTATESTRVVSDKRALEKAARSDREHLAIGIHKEESAIEEKLRKNRATVKSEIGLASGDTISEKTRTSLEKYRREAYGDLEAQGAASENTVADTSMALQRFLLQKNAEMQPLEAALGIEAGKPGERSIYAFATKNLPSEVDSTEGRAKDLEASSQEKEQGLDRGIKGWRDATRRLISASGNQQTSRGASTIDKFAGRTRGSVQSTEMAHGEEAARIGVARAADAERMAGQEQVLNAGVNAVAAKEKTFGSETAILQHNQAMLQENAEKSDLRPEAIGEVVNQVGSSRDSLSSFFESDGKKQEAEGKAAVEKETSKTTGFFHRATDQQEFGWQARTTAAEAVSKQHAHRIADEIDKTNDRVGEINSAFPRVLGAAAQEEKELESKLQDLERMHDAAQAENGESKSKLEMRTLNALAQIDQKRKELFSQVLRDAEKSRSSLGADAQTKIQEISKRSSAFASDREADISAVIKSLAEQGVTHQQARATAENELRDMSTQYAAVVNEALSDVQANQQGLEDVSRAKEVELQTNGEKENTNVKSLEAGSNMVAEFSGDGGNRVRGELVHRVDKVGGEVQGSKLRVDAAIKESDAHVENAGKQLGQASAKLENAVAARVRAVEGGFWGAQDRANQTSNGMSTLEASVGDQLEQAREQDAELQTEARRSAGRTLESTERLLQSQRSVAHNGVSKAQDLAQRLDAFRKSSAAVLQSDALKSLKVLADADRLSDVAGRMNSEYAFWINLFKNDTTDFQDKVAQSLEAANAEESIQREMIKAGERERDENKQRQTAALEAKMDGVFKEDSDDADTGMGNISEDLRRNMDSMRALDAEHLETQKKFMNGLSGTIDERRIEREARIRHQAELIAKLDVEAQKGAVQMSGLERMLGTIQDANTAKIEREQAAVEERSKHLTGALLRSGVELERTPPTIKGLVSEAAELQERHDSLLKRHMASETDLKQVLRNLQDKVANQTVN